MIRAPRNAAAAAGAPAAGPNSLRAGYALAVAAFAWWGMFPLYFKAVASVGPMEVLCHRVLWSAPFCAAIMLLRHDWPALRAALAQKKVLRTLCITAAIIAANWLIFIYAIMSDQVLAASLGYFITPLMNLIMGMVFLGERLNRGQTIAVVLAALGTANLVVNVGGMPWISLALALSFSTYGYLRKTVSVESVNGLLVETTLLSPLALAYLVYQAGHGGLAFGHAGATITVLLACAGVVSSVPLIWFTAGARRIPLYGLGICQYLAPSAQFVLAVALYKEPFTSAHLVTFGLVWAGLVVFLVTGNPWVRRRVAGGA